MKENPARLLAYVTGLINQELLWSAKIPFARQFAVTVTSRNVVS